jgi:hypothetical protein
MTSLSHSTIDTEMKPVSVKANTAWQDSFEATFGDLQIGFSRDPVGRLHVAIFQNNQPQARNVEVTLHIFFGGTITETFFVEDFQPIEKGEWLAEKDGFPPDLFEGLWKERIKVSAQFVD